MPIEFPCPECGRTLRTPDGTAGKQAKCPECQSVAVIPATSSLAVGGDPFASGGGAPAGSGNPFAAASSSPSAGSNPFGSGYQDPANPYASPREVEAPLASQQGGGLVHRRIDFGETASTTWRIFSDNFGMMLLSGLILAGMLFAWNIVSGIVTAVAEAALGMGPFANGGQAGDFPGGGNEMGMLAAYIVVQIISTTLGLIVWAYLQGGMTLYLLDAARGKELQVGRIFAGAPYLLRIFGFNFLTFLVIYGAVGVWILVAVFSAQEAETRLMIGFIGGIPTVLILSLLLLMLGLTPLFIVDRNEGVFSAIGSSWHFMSGNFLVVFGLYIVITLAAGLIALFTCGIGYLGVMPYMFLLQVVIYLLATGQATANRKRLATEYQPPIDEPFGTNDQRRWEP